MSGSSDGGVRMVDMEEDTYSSNASGYGGTKEEDKAMKRRIAQEKREADKLRRQKEAVRKKAQRTKTQVLAQALKLGRKLRAATAVLGGRKWEDDDEEEEEDDALDLEAIVSNQDGELMLAKGAKGKKAKGGSSSNGGLFETSLQTLQQLTQAKEAPRRERPRSQGGGAAYLPPQGAVVDMTNGAEVVHRAYSSAMPEASGGLPGIPAATHLAGQEEVVVPPVAVPPPLPAAAQFVQLPGVAIGRLDATPPAYGALRNGSLPTYREYHGGEKGRAAPHGGEIMSEEQRAEQARLEQQLQNLAVAKQYEDLTRLHNSLPELRRAPPRGAPTRRCAPPTTRTVPMQRCTKRWVYKVGHTDGKLSMLTHSATTRASIDNYRTKLQNVPTEKMRRALLAAKLLNAGSQAPEPLVRRMFHNSQLLVGDLNLV